MKCWWFHEISIFHSNSVLKCANLVLYLTIEVQTVDLRQFCVDHFSLWLTHICVALISHKLVNWVNERRFLGLACLKNITYSTICVSHKKCGSKHDVLEWKLSTIIWNVFIHVSVLQSCIYLVTKGILNSSYTHSNFEIIMQRYKICSNFIP